MNNLATGRSPFEGLGRKGGVTNSWFVIDGNPTTGAKSKNNPIGLQVEIKKGVATRELSQVDAEKIYNDLLAKEIANKTILKEYIEQDRNNARGKQLDNWKQGVAKSRGVSIGDIDWSKESPPKESWIEPTETNVRKSTYNSLKADAISKVKSLTWDEISQRYAGSKDIIIIKLENSPLSEAFSNRELVYRNGTIALVPESAKSALQLMGGPDQLIKQLEEHGTKEIVDRAAHDRLAKAVQDAEAAKNLLQEQSLKNAARVRTAFHYGGRVLLVYGMGQDALRLAVAEDKQSETMRILSGWAGAAAAASAFGAWYAPADAAGPWAWAGHGVGTLGAGIFGYWFGSEIGPRIAEDYKIIGAPTP